MAYRRNLRIASSFIAALSLVTACTFIPQDGEEPRISSTTTSLAPVPSEDVAKVAIRFPEDGAVVNTASVVIAGTVSTPNALVVLSVEGDGKAREYTVPANTHGEFTARVPLSEGPVKVSAWVSDGGDTKEVSFVSFVYEVPPPATYLDALELLVDTGSVPGVEPVTAEEEASILSRTQQVIGEAFAPLEAAATPSTEVLTDLAEVTDGAAFNLLTGLLADNAWVDSMQGGLVASADLGEALPSGESYTVLAPLWAIPAGVQYSRPRGVPAGVYLESEIGDGIVRLTDEHVMVSGRLVLQTRTLQGHATTFILQEGADGSLRLVDFVLSGYPVDRYADLASRLTVDTAQIAGYRSADGDIEVDVIAAYVSQPIDSWFGEFLGWNSTERKLQVIAKVTNRKPFGLTPVLGGAGRSSAVAVETLRPEGFREIDTEEQGEYLIHGVARFRDDEGISDTINLVLRDLTVGGVKVGTEIISVPMPVGTDNTCALGALEGSVLCPAWDGYGSVEYFGEWSFDPAASRRPDMIGPNALGLFSPSVTQVQWPAAAAGWLEGNQDVWVSYG